MASNGYPYHDDMDASWIIGCPDNPLWVIKRSAVERVELLI